MQLPLLLLDKKDEHFVTKSFYYKVHLLVMTKPDISHKAGKIIILLLQFLVCPSNCILETKTKRGVTL